MKTVARRDQIRLKAQTLFRERGYSATSMRDLADGIGIEAASLYNHIGSKEEILRDICFAMAESFFAAIEPVMRSSIDPKEKLRAAMEAHFGVITFNADASAVFLHEWRHMGEPYITDFKLMRRRYERMFRSILEEGMDRGLFRRIDPILATHTLLSATNWTYESYRTQRKPTLEELNQITTILIEGIIAR
ncbi:MAG: TetR/AcrR family transcriptional regulator [Bacteroidota bacterium]|nr:TetR/AcrR family transcriptional regulator [Bacteroidota bacterium]MDP4232060.1 TetR/AcrR family transcriptional regulator [Bacteroidota bacterium]MDP4241233.1 TetR/AcrR family transcriptional regulator [Bacteroidota bacterium]MDP4286625.1 TetR/AcrR family transcriptional regulator [Bacteroidota bacterium]